MTPTTNKLCQLVRKGSMSAPAEAMNKFWEDLRDKSRLRIEHPDLPDSLKTMAGELVASALVEGAGRGARRANDIAQRSAGASGGTKRKQQRKRIGTTRELPMRS